jgi:hypothetical protein
MFFFGEIKTPKTGIFYGSISRSKIAEKTGNIPTQYTLPR